MDIVTWNVQGAKLKWDRIYRQLVRAEFDMLLLQEMTEPPADANCVRECTDYSLYEYQVRTVTWYIVYFRWGRGNPRCSVAVLLKHYEPDDDEIIVEAGERRPLIGVQPGPGQPLVCTLHAVSGYGGRRDALDLLEAIQTLAEANDLPWVLAGDFNTSPSVMAKFGKHWIVCPPKDATHDSGRRLDYAIRSLNCGGSKVCEYFNGRYLRALSDHYPQVFSIRASALFPRQLPG